jgi:hypothetical protein
MKVSNQTYAVVAVTAVSFAVQALVVASIPELRRVLARFWPVVVFNAIMAALVFVFFLYGLNCLTHGPCNTYAWVIVALVVTSTLLNVAMLLGEDRDALTKAFRRRRQ